MARAMPVGSKSLTKQGYVRIKTDQGQRRWPFEHRVVWEAIHGPLPEGWTIHHLDEDKANNDPANLVACPSNGYHHRTCHPTASAETRAKMSAAGRGKPKSPEHRANIAAGLKGKRKSPDHRARLSAGVERAWQDGKFDGKPTNNGEYTEERRRRLAEAAGRRDRRADGTFA